MTFVSFYILQRDGIVNLSTEYKITNDELTITIIEFDF